MFLVAAIAVAGLPPLSGFLAKAALLQHVPDAWLPPVWGAVLGGSLLVVIGLSRAGVRLFWRVPASAEDEPSRAPPRRARMRPVETAATVLLLGYVLAMTVAAGPLMRMADAAAQQLRDPGRYFEQVRDTTPEVRVP